MKPSETVGSRASDGALSSAIERFQAANGLRPEGNMSRGGMTILHLNKVLRSKNRTTRLLSSASTNPVLPTIERQRPSMFDLMGQRFAPPQANCNPAAVRAAAEPQGSPDARLAQVVGDILKLHGYRVALRNTFVTWLYEH